MSTVSPTDHCLDDRCKADDFSGYSVLSIQPKDGEETIRILYYIKSVEDEMYGAYRKINKEFDIMVSAKRMEETKEYLNKNGINYRVSIEDVQKHFEENRAKEKRNETMAE